MPPPKGRQPPSLPLDHQPGVHDLMTKIAKRVGQASPHWPGTPVPDTSTDDFFLNFGLSEQIQRRKENKMGKKTDDSGFLFPSRGGEGGLGGVSV